MVAVNSGMAGCAVALRVVEESADIGMPRALVALERETVVAALIERVSGILCMWEP